MPTIRSNRYGKTRVRLTFVDRTKTPHDLRELSVAILFEGEFTKAYTGGDNSGILPTDTMKNTVYVLARQLQWDSIEALGEGIASHFLQRLAPVSQVSVEIEQTFWTPINQYNAAFTKVEGERRTARIIANHSGTEFTAGLQGLHILKTADSGFTGYLKDELTTLPETNDRLFGTVLKAEWIYSKGNIGFNESHDSIRKILLDTFALHKSLSVQHTLFAMGEAVVKQASDVAEIYLVMPNKHCLLVDLSRFGLDNPNQVFVPTEEPSGYIEARISR